MGALTLDEIVEAGLALTPRTDVGAQAKVQLKAWLRRHARDWPWPILKRVRTGLALSAGTQSFVFGSGNSGVTEKVSRILDPIWLYDSGYTLRQKVRIRTRTDGDPAHDETVNNPSTNVGLPVRAKVRYETYGELIVVPTPVPDRALLLKLDYIIVPDDPADDEAPWYESDDTMIKYVEVFGNQYARRYDIAAQEREVLAAMQREDRVRYGQIDGDNTTLPLDSSVFR